MDDALDLYINGWDKAFGYGLAQFYAQTDSIDD